MCKSYFFRYVRGKVILGKCMRVFIFISFYLMKIKVIFLFCFWVYPKWGLYILVTIVKKSVKKREHWKFIWKMKGRFYERENPDNLKISWASTNMERWFHDGICILIEKRTIIRVGWTMMRKNIVNNVFVKVQL